MKNQLLYVEDNRQIWEEARKELKGAFPSYEVIIGRCSSEVNEKILGGTISLEKIAIVCTDGSLMEDSTGWEVVEGLRARGYTGPTLYTGATQLPKDKKHLYSGQCGKIDGLVEAVQKYLGTQAQ